MCGVPSLVEDRGRGVTLGLNTKANTHCRELSFDVGGMVLVHLQPYRQLFVTQGHHHKLCKRYYGPYPILERIGQVANRVGLPAGSRIHPMFHIFVLFRGKDVFQAFYGRAPPIICSFIKSGCVAGESYPMPQRWV